MRLHRPRDIDLRVEAGRQQERHDDDRSGQSPLVHYIRDARLLHIDEGGYHPHIRQQRRHIRNQRSDRRATSGIARAV